MANYGSILILFLIAFIIASVMFGITSLLGPRAPSAAKEQPFECGHLGRAPFRQRISVKYYVVALLFILFDMEAVFLYPWAVIFKELGWLGFWSMATFILILSLGLVYVWKRGALDWD